MKRCRFLLLCGMFVSLLSNVYGHGNGRHTYDMWRIFPFVNCETNKKIQNFYFLINAYIDYRTFPSEDHIVGAPLCIIENFPHCTFDNHRIWFHWGFNTDPKIFVPLVKRVESNISNGNMKESEREKFWFILHQEIRHRNRYLMDQWIRISGYRGLSSIMVSQRKQSNAFVTILYSIHILGDHQTSYTSIIIGMNSICKDIYKSLENLAGKSVENRAKAKSLENKLRLVQYNPTKFLDTLEKEFMPFLYSLSGVGYDYKTRFQRLGYKMK